MEFFNYRIYGDNIVECLRVIKLIENNTIASFNKKIKYLNQLSSSIILFNDDITLNITLVPGFDKSNRKRWKSNILDEYKKLGSSLDETADVFITEINNDKEKILTVIEFCSALQAGNQAWQRSGRAFSCGQTGIPYFYVIDLPKYELDPVTRERKSLRYPNPVVAYSYLTYTKHCNSPVLQIITKSEEYRSNLQYFDKYDARDIYNDTELENYIVLKLLHKDTSDVEKLMYTKNNNLVLSLIEIMNTDFTKNDINKINIDSPAKGIIDHTNIKFKKTIAKKSATRNTLIINDIISKCSKGIFKSDLPFGIIPRNMYDKFFSEMNLLITISDQIKKEIYKKDFFVVACMKGFKPGGDDNRPDRGILPLLRMIFGHSANIITFIYGPIVNSNFKLLMNDKEKLAKSNGLWQTFINLSDYLIFDCPILGTDYIKNGFIKMNHSSKMSTTLSPVFNKLDLTPVGFREDEVDTLFHLLFEFFVEDAFCGMCNPPGGDWSGISLINSNNKIVRWLSLPRVSDDKRPDHVVQIRKNNKNYLFVMESKDNPFDLEENIGPRLSNYIKWLCDFAPNVEKGTNQNWELCNSTLDFNSFDVITAGSFISHTKINCESIFYKSKCDIIFSCTPINNNWDIEIYYKKDSQIEMFVSLLTKQISDCPLVNKFIFKPLPA